ncbi:MAG: hypothetical protein Tsb0021_18480 [Chlamydiales bacterium]
MKLNQLTIENVESIAACSIGKKWKECKERKMLEENSALVLRVANEKDVLTRDYRQDRMTVYIDDNGIVTRVLVG